MLNHLDEELSVDGLCLVVDVAWMNPQCFEGLEWSDDGELVYVVASYFESSEFGESYCMLDICIDYWNTSQGERCNVGAEGGNSVHFFFV